MFNKILVKHAMWLNNLSLFSNKFNGKHYNNKSSTIKQVTPPEIKNTIFNKNYCY